MTEFNANYYMQERANERARWVKALAPAARKPAPMVRANPCIVDTVARAALWSVAGVLACANIIFSLV